MLSTFIINFERAAGQFVSDKGNFISGKTRNSEADIIISGELRNRTSSVFENENQFGHNNLVKKKHIYFSQQA